MKLTKVEIQPFDAKSDLWSELYDHFQCAIHQTSSLSDYKKITYLKSLHGYSAFSMIAAIWF